MATLALRSRWRVDALGEWREGEDGRDLIVDYWVGAPQGGRYLDLAIRPYPKAVCHRIRLATRLRRRG